MSVHTCGFIFYPIDYNPLLSLFMLFKFAHCPLGVGFYVLTCSYPLCMCVRIVLYFLEPQDIPGQSCAFTNPGLKSATSQRSPGSFCLGIVFQNQDLGTRCVYWHWGIIASRPCKWTDL